MFMEKKIYEKSRIELLKRSFEVENEGMCVRREVAEKVLRETIEYCLKVNKQPQHDWWDEALADYCK